MNLSLGYARPRLIVIKNLKIKKNVNKTNKLVNVKFISNVYIILNREVTSNRYFFSALFNSSTISSQLFNSDYVM